MSASPHLFIVGNQPRFETTVIEGPTGQSIRLIAVPKFRDTGELLLIDGETLEVEVVRFGVFGNDGREGAAGLKGEADKAGVGEKNEDSMVEG